MNPYAERLTDADEEGVWLRVAMLIGTKKPGEYDAAVKLLMDLRAMNERAGRLAEFQRRFTGLRAEHLRKASLIGRFDRAGTRWPLSAMTPTTAPVV